MRIKILLVSVVLIFIVFWAYSVNSRAFEKRSAKQEVFKRVNTDEKVIALTFDDGPHPVFTPKILDILDKYNVKATFFMIGKDMDKYPEIVKEVIERGHVIGNHTYTHPHNIKNDTNKEVAAELEKCEKVIEKLTNKRTYLFRPPRGLLDNGVIQTAQREKYTIILWTVCADHHDAPTPELMAKRVLVNASPGGIILAHDGYFKTRWKDVEATPIIIEELRKKRYRFITVPQLLEIGGYKLD